MFLCAALTASMMATAPALVQAAEEKETTEEQGGGIRSKSDIQWQFLGMCAMRTVWNN